MIPLMRSLFELIVITRSREQYSKRREGKEIDILSDKNNQRNKEMNYKEKKAVGLPCIPKIKRRKWTKRKKAISKFFDELDYNNQIQSSYDLTLLKRQHDYDQHDAA